MESERALHRCLDAATDVLSLRRETAPSIAFASPSLTAGSSYPFASRLFMLHLRLHHPGPDLHELIALKRQQLVHRDDAVGIGRAHIRATAADSLCLGAWCTRAALSDHVYREAADDG